MICPEQNTRSFTIIWLELKTFRAHDIVFMHHFCPVKYAIGSALKEGNRVIYEPDCESPGVSRVFMSARCVSAHTRNENQIGGAKSASGFTHYNLLEKPHEKKSDCRETGDG